MTQPYRKSRFKFVNSMKRWASLSIYLLVLFWFQSAANVIAQKPPLYFIEVSEQAGIDFIHYPNSAEVVPLGAGVVVFDYNNDQMHDVYFVNTSGPNGLFRNNGDGTFTDVALQAGVDDDEGKGYGACAADYDNDGDSDLWVTNSGGSKLFRNNSDGTFSEVTAQANLARLDAGFRSTGCAWGDYDLDGWLDVVVVRYLGEPVNVYQLTATAKLQPLALFHNQADGTFVETTFLLGDPALSGTVAPKERSSIYGAGFQPVWFDMDNDNDLDLYVCNDFGSVLMPNRLWRNNGDGTFDDVSIQTGADLAILCMGIAVGDYDLDGFLDLFVTNGQPNFLLHNVAGERFDVEAAPIVLPDLPDVDLMTWGAMFVDVDNDGDEDLFAINGPVQWWFQRNYPNVFLRNEGQGVFRDVSASVGLDQLDHGRGGAYLDFNNDGCLDLVVANLKQPAKLYQNACNDPHHWLKVKLAGTVSNRDGIGARIKISVGETTQIREVSGGSSHLSQHPLEVHFGLGTATGVETVEVRWPSGIVQTLTNVKGDQRLLILEESTSSRSGS